MEKYANLNGDSGISGFEIGEDWIRVYFTNNSTYKYTHKSAGYKNIEIMKRLATEGRGLHNYINIHTRFAYER
ncbi:MAG TPA: hypothetical protein DIW44_12330 [Anaerolineaceae bacterium]|nr:hypothetical protein [Anaerolineaceae bacterium]